MKRLEIKAPERDGSHRCVTPSEARGLERQRSWQAAELGTRVLSLLRPSLAPKNTAVSPELAAAVDIRDRLWTLLVKRYEDHVWRAGAWLFTTEVDEHVPPLLSRVVKHKKTGVPA